MKALPLNSGTRGRVGRDEWIIRAIVQYAMCARGLLVAAGADTSIRNVEGRTALDEALVQQGRNAETYFPVRTIGLKKLEQTIEILRSR
jgi:hypothetical protein